METYLLGLYERGTPPADIMKRALDRVVGFASQHVATEKGNILILNLDQRDQTILHLHQVLYSDEFSLEKWPFILRFGLWVFDYGTVNHTACQGGWNNWSMFGHYERSGKDNAFVTFFPR